MYLPIELCNGFNYVYYMKIIIGSESFSPNISGVAVATENCAHYCAKAGHQVFVFVPSEQYTTYRDARFKDFTVIRFQSIPNPFRKTFRVAFMAQQEIVREFLKIKPDIVHIQDPTSICSILRKTARRHHVPIVAHNHFNLDYVTSYVPSIKIIHPLLHTILRRYLTHFYNGCDAVICPTHTVVQTLSTWGIATPLHAISNGVDVDRFYSWSNPSDFLHKHAILDKPCILYVGRVDTDKHIDVLIRALPDVLKRHDIQCIIAGDGGEMKRLHTLARTLNVDHALKWLGWIDNKSDDLPVLYQIATIFVHPSPIETQSIVTLEAMASGLPIVAARAGALPELVSDGENGYLFTPGDPHACGSAIVRILDHPEDLEKMRKCSLDKVASHQITTSFDTIQTIYETLCARS